MFEAAHARGAGGAVPRDAHQAAGRRAADAGEHRAQGAGRRARAGSGGDGSPSSTTGLQRPRRSARCTGPCGTTGARSRSRCSTPAPARRCIADLDQLARLGRMFGSWIPGLDIRPLLDELQRPGRRGARLPAARPRRRTAFARGLRRRPGVRGPGVVAGGEQVAGHRVGGRRAAVAGHRGGHPGRARPAPGCSTARFLFSGPARAGLLHADPHPGNFRLTADGRLGVVDFGAVARLPDGLPEPIGRLLGDALDGDAEAVRRRPARRRVHQAARSTSTAGGAARLPRAVPRAGRGSTTFRFNRAWMRGAVRPHQRPAAPRLHARPAGSTCRRRTC